MATFQIPSTQRAAVLREAKGKYRIENDWPVTQPNELKPGECLVKLEYSGVCHTDMYIRDEAWGVFPPFPLVGGHEGVGIVVAIGEHTSNPNVKIGDRVGLKYMACICETCEMCLSGHETGCPTFVSHGNQMHGTFQEYAVSYVNHVSRIPDGLDSRQAAPILCAGLTAYKGIQSSGARIGQWIAIAGAGGGVGHLAVQYAVAQGLRVIAIGTGERKKKLAMSLGAEKWVDYKRSKDLVADVKAATGGPGPQVAVVTTSKLESFEQAAMYLKSTGTLICVGFPDGLAAFNIPISLVIGKSLRIIGSIVGNRQEAEEALGIAALGKVQCSYETRSLEDLNDVFQDMADGKVVGRVVLRISSSPFDVLARL